MIIIIYKYNLQENFDLNKLNDEQLIYINFMNKNDLINIHYN